MMKNLQEISNFLPWILKESWKSPCSKLQKLLHLKNPSNSTCHVSTVQAISELAPWHHVWFPPKSTWTHMLSTCGYSQPNSNFENLLSVQLRTRHHVESGRVQLLYMHVQRSHCLHVLIGYPRSLTTLLQDVAHDTPPRKVTHGFTLAKHKSQTTSNRKRNCRR